jgi:hypothetical protein
VQLVDQAIREHGANERAAAAGVQVAIDLALEAADRFGIVAADGRGVPPDRIWVCERQWIGRRGRHQQ